MLKTVVIVFAVIVLTACGAPGPIMPGDRGAAERNADSTALSGYRVVRGDTLYSIAFRYGLDWRELARINRIAPPYTIRVGQTLQLRSSSIASTARQPADAAQDPIPGQTGTIGPPPRRVESRTIASTETPSSQQPEPAPDREAEASAPQAEPAPPIANLPPIVQTSPPAPSQNGSSEPAARTASSTADIRPIGNGRSVAGTTWFWPTEGRLTRRFNANDTRKGIHIAGEQGQSVRATADGEVVYSGNGLIGYGELIIIKHSDSMLSAYAHNRQRQVEQGDRVQAGQQIASMGEFEPNRPLLHFEIRRNGQPDDPLKYLPAR